MDFQCRRARGGGSGGGSAGGRGRGGGGPGGRGRDYGACRNNVAGFRQLNVPCGDGASGYQQGPGSGRSGYHRQTPVVNHGCSGDGHQRGNAPRHAKAAPHQERGSKGGREGRFKYVEVRSLNPSSMSNG